MKLSANLRQEIRVHLSFLGSAWMLPASLYFAFQWGLFDSAPAEFVVCFGVFMTIGLYVWFRQGLSADKTQFKPRIW